jgi:hypothetical protein
MQLLEVLVVERVDLNSGDLPETGPSVGTAISARSVERETGFEPAASTLAIPPHALSMREKGHLSSRVPLFSHHFVQDVRGRVGLREGLMGEAGAAASARR